MWVNRSFFQIVPIYLYKKNNNKINIICEVKL